MTPQEKAEVLIEALPWLEKHHGATVVVKFGGNAMVERSLMRAFADDIAFLRIAGLRPVVVHGGGPQISAALKARGIPSQFKAGLRVTTPEVMEVVRDVLVEHVQRELVDLISEHGSIAHGISGEDILIAERRDAVVEGVPTDVGLVGDVIAVDAAPLHALIEAAVVPVISTVAIGTDGTLYNVNADSAAAAVAVAVHAAKFVVLTDVAGLYRNWPDTSELIDSIAVAELEQMLPRLESGMVPKMEACITAIRGGLPAATVVDGRMPHCVLVEAFTSTGVGTMVVP